MRFLREIYRAIRTEVGEDFPIGVKLNSADFQRGGFSEEESMQVIQTLQADGLDLVEVSGGNYENPSMVGANVKESTLQREAYFLEYAELRTGHERRPCLGGHRYDRPGPATGGGPGYVQQAAGGRQLRCRAA